MIDNHTILPALLRNHFELFLQFAARELGTMEGLEWNFHIDAIIHELEEVRQGRSKRLIITLPPRHLKSVIMTAWIAWMMGKDPSLRFMCISYGSELAEKHASHCLKIITSSWYRRAFPALCLTKRAVHNFETSQGGYRLSTSIDGAQTGIGAHYIVIDDPIKAGEAYSEGERLRVNTMFDASLKQRLESQDLGSIILVMQRLHEDDLAGYLLSRGGWNELRLSAIASSDELVQVGPNRFYQRREGHALHPERQSLAVLEKSKAENPFVFEAQYNQDPMPLTGNFVNPAWFLTYDEEPPSGMNILSLDTASKTALTNDYTVGIVARYYQRRFYILDVVRERMDFTTLRKRVEDLCRKYAVDRLLIEEASSGEALIDMLRPPPEGVPFPIACKPEGNKTVRFYAQASKIEAGELVLPRTAPWAPEFIKELAAFPNGKFDDQADAAGQLLRHGAPMNDFDSDVCSGPELIEIHPHNDDADEPEFGFNPFPGFDD